MKFKRTRIFIMKHTLSIAEYEANNPRKAYKAHVFGATLAKHPNIFDVQFVWGVGLGLEQDAHLFAQTCVADAAS